jgi:hypothetical protein
MTATAGEKCGPQDVSAGPGDRSRLTALQGLAALSLDALSSVAYGPDAIVVVLIAAGGARPGMGMAGRHQRGGGGRLGRTRRARWSSSQSARCPG